jgi:hypothetical protein
MSDLPFKVDVYLWTSTKKKKKVIIMIERYNISNVQMDRPFPIPPGNAACPPWFPPPTHMPP